MGRGVSNHSTLIKNTLGFTSPCYTSGTRGTREGTARGQRGLGEERGERREGNKEMFCYVMVLDCYVV